MTSGNVSGAPICRDDREALEESLIEYLRDVSLNEMVIDDGGAEFQKMVTGFSDCLPAVEREHYRTIIAKTSEALRYCFIDFNYTRYLDKLVEEAKKINPFGSHTGGGTHYTDEIMIPIHIHGELDDELLLGVNDKTQIGDGKGDPIPAIEEYLIKPNVNRKLGNQKIAQVEEIIDKSMFVCVFGMSLGETDKDWWCCLGKWLEQSPDRRLVLFMYEGPGLITSGSRRTRLEDRYRSRFIDMIGKTDIADQLSAQITVVLNSWIFKFEHVKMKPFSADAGTDGSR